MITDCVDHLGGEVVEPESSEIWQGSGWTEKGKILLRGLGILRSMGFVGFLRRLLFLGLLRSVSALDILRRLLLLLTFSLLDIALATSDKQSGSET